MDNYSINSSKLDDGIEQCQRCEGIFIDSDMRIDYKGDNLCICCYDDLYD